VGPPPSEARLTRKRALGWLGGLGLAVVLPGCADDAGSNGSAAGTTATQGTTTTAAAAVPDCVLTPEVTEGPYYLDLNLMRSNITEGRSGLAFDLAVKVVDASSCDPIANAAVDVWHCDAAGEYSGTNGNDETFMRGIQVTGADGVATFRTVFPGWYRGRAVHIHLKVHQGDQTWTGQLFFDEATIDAVYATAPYSSRGPAETSNSADSIFDETDGSTVVAAELAADRAGGSVTVGIARV
jgi:protocatechuate 3,4-dioxygenase beta subunit